MAEEQFGSRLEMTSLGTTHQQRNARRIMKRCFKAHGNGKGLAFRATVGQSQAKSQSPLHPQVYIRVQELSNFLHH